MGTPIIDSDPGALCAQCWGVGKSFGEVTPKYLTCIISNVDFNPPGTEPGPNDRLPNETFELTQTAAACTFETIQDDYLVQVKFVAGVTSVFVFDNQAVKIPFSSSDLGCVMSGVSINHFPYVTAGTFNLSWSV